MGIFTEIYCLRLNIVQDTNVLQVNLSSNFCGEQQIEFITKMYLC